MAAGGRGGSYRAVIDVLPGDVFTYTIGAPGTGGRAHETPPYSATAGGNAGNITVTHVRTGITYIAYGGGGGPVGYDTNITGTNGTGGGSGGTGLGAFGGLGGISPSGAGQAGQPGEIVFENYQSNGLISRPEWETLIGHLSERFTNYTWP